MKLNLKSLIYLFATIVLVFAFTACGSNSDPAPADTTEATQTSGEDEITGETVTYQLVNKEVKEDIYTSTITIIHDGDNVLKVTNVACDDFSKEKDESIIDLNMQEFGTDTSDADSIEGYDHQITTDNKKWESTCTYNITKMNFDDVKAQVILWPTNKDYLSFEEYAKYLEEQGYKTI